jgi:hypothetical protein
VEAAGLADGHASKLLCGLSNFGALTLFPVLEIAGLRLALVEDPGALERASKLKKRASEQVRHQLAGVTRGMLKACRPAVLSELAAKGGKARMARLSPALDHACLACSLTMTGSVKENVDPWPTIDSTQIFPPCISIMRFEIASPKPVPPFFFVTELSAC